MDIKDNNGSTSIYANIRDTFTRPLVTLENIEMETEPTQCVTKIVPSSEYEISDRIYTTYILVVDRCNITGLVWSITHNCIGLQQDIQHNSPSVEKSYQTKNIPGFVLSYRIHAGGLNCP